MLRHRFLGIAALFSAAVLLCGCNSGTKLYGVRGTVKYQGKPVPSGTISFIPEGAVSPAGGAAITDGAYAIPAATGLPAGKYKVSISYPDPKGSVPDPNAGGAPGVSREVKEMLPAEYNRDTKLQVEVTPGGANEFPFDLK